MDLEHIKSKIHIIRGRKVLLDFDLAEMYQVKTKELNLSVKRNMKRFPPDFMFQITVDEWHSLRLQNETSKRGGRRYLPYAFTEQGVAMLSGLLNSDIAIDTNIAIMRAFVAVRHLLINPPIDEVKELQNEMRQLKQYIEEVFTDYNEINEDTQTQIDNINQSLSVANTQFSEIYQALTELAERKKELEKPRNPIGFKT